MQKPLCNISGDTGGYQSGYAVMTAVIRYTSAMADSQPSLLRLTVVAGPRSGVVIPWDGSEEEFVLGRDSRSHIELPDLTASRRHCRLLRTREGIELEDLGSANGTVFRGQPLTGRARIDPGEEFAIGESRLRLDLVPGVAAGRPVAIEVEKDEADPPLSCDTVKLPVEPDHEAEAQAPDTSRETRDVESLHALLDAAGALADAISMPELAHAVCRTCFSALPAQRAALVIEDGNIPATWGWVRAGAANRFPVSRTVLNIIRKERVGLLCNDVRRHQRLSPSESLAEQSVRSLLAVPLRARDRNLGMLYLDRIASGAAFEERHLKWAVALARITALAVNGLQQRERLERENRHLRAEVRSGAMMLGESAGIRQLYRMLTRVAPTDASVLLMGETGTGKELAAKILHSGSARSNGPFIGVNCATLTENLLESDLFGHERGAFTGAVTQRKGKFELAQGGTIFLDELAELALPLQARLLRALQERVIERVGGSRSIPVNVRVIAATNRDLATLVATGGFRSDLYHRLNVVQIRIPALRERREDIPLLAAYFTERHAARSERQIRGVSDEALAVLNAYNWPGNVRELENAIERAVVLGQDEWIMPEDLPDHIRVAVGGPGEGSASVDWVREAKRQKILNTFEKSGCSYSETARRLNMLPNNLHRLITNLDLRNEIRARKLAQAGSMPAPSDN